MKEMNIKSKTEPAEGGVIDVLEMFLRSCIMVANLGISNDDIQ